jgi:hypothetical protein
MFKAIFFRKSLCSTVTVTEILVCCLNDAFSCTDFWKGDCEVRIRKDIEESGDEIGYYPSNNLEELMKITKKHTSFVHRGTNGKRLKYEQKC